MRLLADRASTTSWIAMAPPWHWNSTGERVPGQHDRHDLIPHASPHPAKAEPPGRGSGDAAKTPRRPEAASAASTAPLPHT